MKSCEQLRTLAGEKKQAAERIEKLLASAPPSKLYADLCKGDAEDADAMVAYANAQKQAKRLRAYSKVLAKVEFLERREQMNQRTLAVKRHGLELLRQDVVRLSDILFTFCYFCLVFFCFSCVIFFYCS